MAQFNPSRIEDFCRGHQQEFDLILAAHLPITYDKSPTWKETCLSGARRILSLAQVLSKNSLLVFGYNPEQKPSVLEMLTDNFRLDELFTERRERYGCHDHWLMLKGVNSDFYQEANENPSELLTEVGKRQRSSYAPRFLIIGWDA